jgi:hypothetical protein
MYLDSGRDWALVGPSSVAIASLRGRDAVRARPIVAINRAIAAAHHAVVVVIPE